MKHKTILINIKGQPPTQAELDAVKKRLLPRTVVAVIACISVGISTAIIMHSGPTTSVIFVTLIVASILAVLSMKITERSYLHLSLFDPLDPEYDADAVLEYSKLLSDPAVAAYHAKVLSQGRVPVILELEAALEWVKGNFEREKINEAKAAFAKITTKERASDNHTIHKP